MRYAGVLALVLVVSCSDVPETNDQVETDTGPKLKVTAEHLGQTVVTADLDYPITEGRNLLWCATFQMAWNELCELARGPVRMVQEDPLVTALNRRSVARGDLDPDTYVAFGGIATDEMLGSARADVQRLLGGSTTPELLPAPGSVPDGTLVAYCCLFADLPFEWAFTRFRYPLHFGDGTVASFGIEQFDRTQENEARAADQLRVLDFRGRDDFIVVLRTRSPDHSLYLAMIPPEPTLRATVQTVRQRVASAEPQELGHCADLRIPILDFDIMRQYGELLGRPLSAENPAVDGRILEVALQQIRFRLDERGALLKSEALMMDAIAPCLVFKRPFLVMMQYAPSDVPYFALWVDNPELLVPFEGEWPPK